MVSARHGIGCRRPWVGRGGGLVLVDVLGGVLVDALGVVLVDVLGVVLVDVLGGCWLPGGRGAGFG